MSKSLREIVDVQRQVLIEKIHGTTLYPKGFSQLSYILKTGAEFQDPHLTTTQKLQRLIQNLAPTLANLYGLDLPSLGKLNERATDTQLFEYAIRVGDLSLMQKFDPEQFNFFQTRDFFYFAAKDGHLFTFLELSRNKKIRNVESVLKYVLNDPTTKPENAQILVEKNPHLSINRAVKNATLKGNHVFLAVLLSRATATNFNSSFDPFAGEEDFLRTEGLHSSLIVALDRNDIASFNQLLQLNPSLAILQNIRDRAIWINSQVDAGVFVNPGNLRLEDITHQDTLRTPFIDAVNVLLG